MPIYLDVIFFFLAAMAGLLGFTELIPPLSNIARVLFFIFSSGFLISLVIFAKTASR